MSAADQTRAALVGAALRLFGRQGFDGTSTREIAAAANANIGSIAYHFGGKEGLRAAAADYIVETVGGVAAQALGKQEATGAVNPAEAEAQLVKVLETMVSFLVARPEAGEIALFVLRELSQPTAALDRIYAGVFEPTHRRLCGLWETATGEPAESEATKLTIFTLIGQVVYFRIAREAVLRRMGWADIGAENAAKVAAAAKANLFAMLEARKGARP
jgi:AcrR family transcriptional regulator